MKTFNRSLRPAQYPPRLQPARCDEQHAVVGDAWKHGKRTGKITLGAGVDDDRIERFNKTGAVP